MSLLLLGALFCVLLTPLSMRLAYSIGAIDLPDGGRKRHSRPTPRLGGLALYLSVLLPALAFLPATPLRGAWLSGGALLCALGVSDDVFTLSPRLKLLAELAIATLPVAFGLSPEGFSAFGGVFSLPAWVMGLYTALWVTALSNAFNLIDGLDTLAVSQAMLSLCAFLAFPEAWLLFGALIGFLPYNKLSLTLTKHPTPTRSFLGDTGALFIGYSLSLAALARSTYFSLFLPLAFLFPLGECLSSFIRRALNGKNPLSADRGHLHHILLRRTRSTLKTVLALGSISVTGLLLFWLLGS